MKRRDFIKSSVALGTVMGAGFITGCQTPKPKIQKGSAELDPIQMVFERHTKKFTGDDFTHGHAFFRDKTRGRADLKTSSIKLHHSVVVVGGGMSGLLSAYYLRDMKPLIIERAPHLGGNSQGESFQGQEFSIGAAYVITPDAESELEKLFKELNLTDKFKKEEVMDVLYQGQITRDFWSGNTDPKNKKVFQKVYKRLAEIYADEFPDIPMSDDLENQSMVNKLDQIPFAQWLQKEFGNLPPSLHEYFQLYGWSAFSANIEEISTAQMLNFVTCETDGAIALPGGNSKIAQAVYQKLQAAGVSFKNNSMVIKIHQQDRTWNIDFVNAQGELQTVTADHVIYTAPKFLLPHLMTLTAAEKESVQQIQTRSYVVANLVLDRKLNINSYDMYCLRGQPPQAFSVERPYADVLLGTWTQPGNTVLTMYKPFATPAGRSLIIAPESHQTVKTEIANELRTMQAALGLRESDLASIRLSGWGHPIPLASTGLIAKKALEPLQNFARDNFYLAGQDLWVNPSFECAHETAFRASQKVKKSVDKID